MCHLVFKWDFDTLPRRCQGPLVPYYVKSGNSSPIKWMGEPALLSIAWNGRLERQRSFCFKGGNDDWTRWNRRGPRAGGGETLLSGQVQLGLMKQER